MQLNNAVECVGQLEDQLDESNVEKAQGNVNEMKERWDVVTKRLDEFCNRDIPVSTLTLSQNSQPKTLGIKHKYGRSVFVD